MNCAEARLRIGAEPTVISDALTEHLRGCASCSEFRREMIALESNIHRALETPLHMPASQRSKSLRDRPLRERWALAASVLLAFAIGSAFWAFLPGPSLAQDVVTHTKHEPASWSSTIRLSQSSVDEVTRDLGVSFDAQAHHIAYARACPFRGRTVPHLVVTTGHGSVTVLVLRERIRSPRRFVEDGYSGILLPASQGSLAVLARGRTDVEAAAREVQNAIRPQPATPAATAPELTHTAETEWLNSKPLTLAHLRGQVVLVEFWTFDCVNCRRTLPWLKAMHERYGDDGLVIVSVHTPEFARERDAANVRAAVKELGIRYAVMLDNDFSYWKAIGNRYWPAFYLIDRSGRIVATQIGELHVGQKRGAQFESEIRGLLAAS